MSDVARGGSCDLDDGRAAGRREHAGASAVDVDDIDDRRRDVIRVCKTAFVVLVSDRGYRGR
jgi:hypothetical protein